MTFNTTRAWMAAAMGFGDAAHSERYAIAAGPDGYVALDPLSQLLTLVVDTYQAIVFHAHEKAVRVARALSALSGPVYEVLRLKLSPQTGQCLKRPMAQPISTPTGSGRSCPGTWGSSEGFA